MERAKGSIISRLIIIKKEVIFVTVVPPSGHRLSFEMVNRLDLQQKLIMTPRIRGRIDPKEVEEKTLLPKKKDGKSERLDDFKT
jgi:hypothetical protein